MRDSISKFLFTVLCLSAMVKAQSQSIDTTKFYTLTNVVAGEKLEMTECTMQFILSNHTRWPEPNAGWCDGMRGEAYFPDSYRE